MREAPQPWAARNDGGTMTGAERALALGRGAVAGAGLRFDKRPAQSRPRRCLTAAGIDSVGKPAMPCAVTAGGDNMDGAVALGAAASTSSSSPSASCAARSPA